MASKLAGIDVKHGDVYMVYPEDLVMITDKADPLYDPRVDLPVSEEHILNAMSQGIKQPVLITRRDQKYVIVEGRQRYKRAIEANKRLKKAGEPLMRIPAMIERGDEKSQLITMIALNELRVADEFMTKIMKMTMLFARGATEAEVANAFGVTTTAIRQWQKINDASVPVKKAIASGQIAPSAAAKLSSLPPDKQKEALEKVIAETQPGKKASIKAVTKAVKKSSGEESDSAGFISIKVVKRVIFELEKKGLECTKEEHHFLEGLKFATGLVEAENLCFVSEAVGVATGLIEPPAAEEDDFQVEETGESEKEVKVKKSKKST